MFPIVVIGLLAVVGISLVLIFSAIDDQQDLAEINQDIAQTQIQRSQESINVIGTVDSNSILLENSMHEDVNLLQIRVYGDDSTFVKSFSVNGTIPSNGELDLSNLPVELQGMLLE